MKQLKLNLKKIRVIEVSSMDLVPKDTVVLKKIEDFEWFIQEADYVLKCEDTYYFMGSEVAWIWHGDEK